VSASAATIIADWPEQSREAAQTAIEVLGEPQESTPTHLHWHEIGEWRRVTAQREFYEHEFPAPHIDSVESVIDYRVPPERFSDLAAFDGSVIAERTAGVVSARCHDLEANRLALNLMNDIVRGAKTVDEARQYYAKEFADYRRGKPTPYMRKLHFTPGLDDPRDPDERVLSDAELQEAVEEGRRNGVEG
jgi:hypothetical protein